MTTSIKTINQHIKNLSSLSQGDRVIISVINEIDSYMTENQNDFQLHLNLIPKLKELKDSKQVKGKALAIINDFIEYAKAHSKVTYSVKDKAYFLHQSKKGFLGWVSFEYWLSNRPEKETAEKVEKSDKERLLAYIQKNGLTKDVLLEVLKSMK
jgi:hypothetical protein